MPRTSRRSLAIVVITIAIVAVGLAYLLRPPHQTHAVALPARDATPEAVVTAYLTALDAHDCRTVTALTTSGARKTAKTWCDDVARLTNIRVHHHVTERPQDSGHATSQEVAHVPVTFDLRWRPLHNDASMRPGATRWGYLVVRDSHASPWRIFDQGTG